MADRPTPPPFKRALPVEAQPMFAGRTVRAWEQERVLVAELKREQQAGRSVAGAPRRSHSA